MIVVLEMIVVPEMIVGLHVTLIVVEIVIVERIAEMLMTEDHLGGQVLDHGGTVNVRKMQNGNQEIVMTMDHQDVILIDNRHPDDQTMLEAIEAVTIGDLAHLEEGEIEAEIVEAPAMSEDQEMIDLEIGMIADHAIEMIGDLKEETME